MLPKITSIYLPYAKSVEEFQEKYFDSQMIAKSIYKHFYICIRMSRRGYLTGFVFLNPDILPYLNLSQIQCHGGITYSSMVSPTFDSLNKGVGYIGFSCWHTNLGDYVPYLTPLSSVELPNPYGLVWRNEEFVLNQLKLIVDQIIPYGSTSCNDNTDLPYYLFPNE